MQGVLFEFKEYKVSWKKFESIYSYEMIGGVYYNKFVGFSDKIKRVTTCGLMTLSEAESFAKFVSEGLYEYAGWHKIIKVKK